VPFDHRGLAKSQSSAFATLIPFLEASSWEGLKLDLCGYTYTRPTQISGKGPLVRLVLNSPVFDEGIPPLTNESSSSLAG